MIIPFDNAGSVGVIGDIASYATPPEAWSSATNIRFNDGYAQKTLGYSTFYTPSSAPHFIFPIENADVFYWLYANNTKIMASEGAAEYDLTRTASDYNGSTDDKWTGTVLGGIPIVCNGLDDPQMLNPVAVSGTFADLTNWPADTTCRVMKSFKNHLISLDITKSGTRYPYMIKWSHPADAGTVPTSWDESDPTLDAGENELAERGGYLVDGGTLGDTFIIYREASIFEMRYIGGKYIFGFRKLFDRTGLYARRCFVDYEGGHCFLSNDDLMTHNGTSVRSVLDRRYRDTLFSALRGATNSSRTFLAPNYAKNEIWVCYPEGADEFPTKALVWNYRDDTVGFVTLPGASDINFDVVQPTTLFTWDSDSDTWDSDETKWDARQYDPSMRGMIMADATNTKIYKMDDTNQFNGTSFTSTLERQGLAVIGRDRKGQAIVDLKAIKRVRAVYPKFDADAGTVITVYVGYQMETSDSVTWDSGTAFTVGTDYKVDTRTTGRLIAIKFETTGDVAWKLNGFDLDITVVGGR